jgi:uncharacterized membrane protein
MIEQIKAWIAQKGGWTHALALIFTSLMVAYSAVPQFHDLVNQIHQVMPGWLEELLTTVLALIAFYKNWDAKAVDAPAPPK